MNGEVTEGFDWQQKFRELQKQVLEGKPDCKEFRETAQVLSKMQRDFQRLLEEAVKDQRGKEKSRDLERLLRSVSTWNASDLIEQMKIEATSVRKTKAIKDAFDNQGYRILELVRAGKRDEVFHSILRIFVAAKKEFPKTLVEPFKPVYSDELFKIFLFSFLSGILGKEEENKEGGNHEQQ
jgi:hypothetical protein